MIWPNRSLLLILHKAQLAVLMVGKMKEDSGTQADKGSTNHVASKVALDLDIH